jgi:hypothetical protein
MSGIGSKDLKRHLKGEFLSPMEAIQAKCAECVCNYVDGRVSCDSPACPLFPFHPYNPNRRKREYPTRKGVRPSMGRS